MNARIRRFADSVCNNLIDRTPIELFQRVGDEAEVFGARRWDFKKSRYPEHGHFDSPIAISL